MAPKFLSFADKAGRPIWCVAVQLGFGLLAFIGVSGNSGAVFDWLLVLSGLAFVLG